MTAYNEEDAKQIAAWLREKCAAIDNGDPFLVGERANQDQRVMWLRSAGLSDIQIGALCQWTLSQWLPSDSALTFVALIDGLK